MKMESLVKAYSHAIEYYQSIESDLFADMTVKLQQFLIKPETLALMADEDEDSEEFEEDKLLQLPEPTLENNVSDTSQISTKLRRFCRMPTPMNNSRKAADIKPENPTKPKPSRVPESRQKDKIKERPVKEIENTQSNNETKRQKFLAELRGGPEKPDDEDDAIHHKREAGNKAKRSFKRVKNYPATKGESSYGGEIYRPKLPPKLADK